MDSLFAGHNLVILGVAVSILFALKSAKLVRPGQRMIVERLGAYNRTCGPGWHLIVPFVERSILLPLSEFVPGWEAYAEEQLSQKLVHDFYQKPYRDAQLALPPAPTGPNEQCAEEDAEESDVDPEVLLLGPKVRFRIFAFFFGFGVVQFIVELKTGYDVLGFVMDVFFFLFSRHGSITSIKVHGPWSWDKVWTYLPHELATHFFLPFCVLAFVVGELWYRLGWRFGYRE
jgi:hypothetical protein